jgi:lambda family phage tail tape measure protein
MTDFRINVIIDPRGATSGGKAVERQLGRVETQANKVQLALRKAFAGLSIAFAIKEVVQFAEAFTDLQNRLRLLVPAEAELVRTTRDLLKVANDTRTAFEGTVILYQRLGLATRELGIGGDDLIGVVRSINQALILSGASAKEANNGLIQLSQGIAANRLGGDELRSTLEQLPAVADVIARELGVTRGELRTLGAEGKITGDIIIEAFRNAREELDENFNKTVPTLSQSFTVLKNNLTVFFGELNKGTGVLQVLGAAVRFVGNNVDALARSLTVAAATFAALRLAPTIQAFVELRQAVAAGRAVILGSAAAAKQKAIFDRDQAAAALQAAGAEVQKTRTALSDLAVQRQRGVVTVTGTTQTLAQAEAELFSAAALANKTRAAIGAQKAELQLASTRAGTNTVFGDGVVQLIAIEKLEKQLIADNAALAAAETRLASATAAVNEQKVVENSLLQKEAALKKKLTADNAALAAAETRLASATAAANAQANIFTRTLAKARAALLAVNAAIVANPIGAIVVALTAVITALVVFRDKIKISGDGITTLGDLFQAFGNRVSNVFSTIFSVIKETLGPAYDFIVGIIDDIDFSFRGFAEAIATYFDTIYGVIFGVVSAIASLIGNIPDIFDRAFRKAVNFVASALEFVPRTILAIVKTGAGILGDFIGGVLTAVTKSGQALDALFEKDFAKAAKLAAEAGDAISEGFAKATSDIGDRFRENFDDNFFNGVIPRLEEPAGKTFGEIGKEAAGAFSKTFTEFTFFGDAVTGLFDEAEAIGRQRTANEQLEKEAEVRNKAAAAAKAQADEVAKVTQALRDEQSVLQTALASGQLQADIQRELITLRAQLAEEGLAPLTPTQEEDIAVLIRRNDQLRKFIELQNELVSPQEKLAEKEALIRQAFEEGFITLQKYEEALRRVKLEQIELGTTAVDEFTQALKEQQLVLGTTLLQGQLQADIQRELLALQEELAGAGEDPLTKGQEEEIAALIKRNDVLRQYAELQNELISPQEQLAEKEALIRQARAEGILTLQQYEEALRRVKLEQAELGTSVSDGLVTGMQKVSESLNDVASLAETAFVNAFSAAEDALVAFATGGSVTFREFASSLIKDIVRLITRLLILQALQAAAGVGGPVGNFFGDLAGVAGGAPEAAATGSTMAVANKPFLVGEEGPELFTPGQTGSITPTDQTVGALANASSPRETVVNVSVPPAQPVVNTYVVEDESKITQTMESPAGERAIINVIRKNPSLLQRL